MMKGLFARVCVACSLLLICASSAFTQERDLQLIASVINQQYCMVNASTDVVQLTLNLRYTNTGSQKLILYKGHRLFYQVFISRSKEEATARKYEIHTTHARYYDEQPEKINHHSPSGVFTILPPGASYETKQVIAVAIAREGSSKFNTSILPGAHVLNLTASTWYESRKLAEELRERWQRSGYLWADPVGSSFASFVVDNQRPAVSCH
jgi:hypothetical protein